MRSISFDVMEDAVRPDEQSFKAMYKRGYCTWFSLYETAIADTKTHLLWQECVVQLENAFLDNPSLPKNLALDASFSNTAIATGISTWTAAQGPSDLPTFDQDFYVLVASDHPITLVVSDSHESNFNFPRCISSDNDDHITLLILAWTYTLSVR